MSLPEAPIIELDFTDSTNNYAMRLIDGNKAQDGLTIVANAQTDGKGQRGKTWVDVPGNSLLMSIIVTPRHSLAEQFVFNAAVTVSIAKVLQKLDDHWRVAVKWPNDIIVNDKKAGGILIENVLRGSSWTHSVIGLGLNVNQARFSDDLPHAISLKMASGRNVEKSLLLTDLRDAIFKATKFPVPVAMQMEAYNQLLYRQGMTQGFKSADTSWKANILHANNDGTLAVQLEDGSIVNYQHGQVIWDYGSSR